jgi:hypothetical protein
MKKMMISTALATSLIAGAASADTSVSAYIETTLGSGETPATANQVQQGTTIGYEHGLAFSGSKDLDNGMTLKTYFGIEDGGAADERGITFVTGNTEIMIESDVNNIDDKQAVPTIVNKIEDGNKGLGVSYNANKHTIHNDNGIGVRHKTDMGTLSLKYVPKLATGSGFNDSNPASADKGSGLAYGFNGSLGVDGLGVLVSFSAKDTSSLDSKEQEQQVIGVSYNFGNIKVGAQQTEYENTSGSGYSYADGSSTEATSYAATMAVNDQISVGIQYAELSGDGLTADEEITSFSAGYNLGGATIGLQYHNAENVDGSSGSDGEAIELRVKQSF